MNHPYTISLHAHEGFAVLPRLALLFSRRRLRIDRLEMTGADEPALSRFTVELCCEAATIERLVRQLWRIVEVTDVAIAERTASVMERAAAKRA